MDEKDAASQLGGIFKNLNQVLLAFAIAGFFGLVRVLQDYISPEAPAKFRWLIAIAKTLIAGSAGMVTMWLMLEWHVGPYMAAFCVAIAGYGGAETLQVGKEAMYDFIRRKAQTPPK